MHETDTEKPTETCAEHFRRPSRYSISVATPPSHPAKVLEGLSVDDSGEVLDNDTEALLLQLCGETPHLLSPLDFWETANQLLSATERGYCVLHSLNGNTYQLKKLSLGENTK